MTDDTPPLEIDWLKTLGGALAAVTTAVLLSTLGAAGTLIGAALGSIAVTVSTQLYTQGLARSRDTMAKAQESALARVGVAQGEVRRAGRRRGPDAHLARADEQLSGARADLADPVDPADGPDPVDPGAAEVEEPAGLGERVRGLPWRRIGVLAAAMFVVVLLLIGTFEQLAGRSVASYTGGSDRDSGSIVPSGGDRGDRGNQGDQGEDGQDDRIPGDQGPDDGATPTPDPDAADPDAPEETSPADGATPTPAPTSGSPTPSPSPTPSSSGSPSSAPTPSSPAPAPTGAPSRAPTG